MTRKITLIFFSLLLSIGFASAQSKKAYIKAARNAATIKDYGSALFYYKIIVEDAEISDIPTIYEAAEVARSYRAYVQAEDYYSRVAASERQAEYPLAYFWLGTVRKSMGKYNKAVEAFNNYLTTNSTPDGLYAEKAQKEIQDCQWAIGLGLNVENLDTVALDSTVVALDSSVNSVYSDVAGLRIGDQFYYSSLRFDDKEPSTAIKIGQLMAAKEQLNGQLFGGDINDVERHTINGHYHPESKRFYYNVCESINATDVRCAIYYRTMEDENKWSTPVKLPDHINQVGYTTTQPTIGINKENGKTYLFFSSDRPNGEGKMDIWCSVMGSDGNFSHPVNVKALNTPENDITPYYHSPSGHLFFSSKGRQSLGGYDIYYAKGISENWEEIQHLEHPVSTSFDDVFFSLSSGLDQPKGYLSSNRPGTMYADSSYKYVCNDIFNYDIRIDLRALTYNEIDTTIYLKGCTVQLIDKTSGELVASKSNFDGNDFDFRGLKAEREYMLIATKDQYGPDTVSFDTYGIFKTTSIERPLYLPPRVFLDASTYTYIRYDTMELTGCTVELYDITAEKAVFENMTPIIANSHKYFCELEIGHRYRITATKEGYTKAVALANTVGITEPDTLIRKLYLTRDIDEFKLMKVYFSNDSPGPRYENRNGRRVYATSTDSSYNRLYDQYYANKDFFISQFDNDPEEKERLEQFFEGQVRAGMERLGQFAVILLEYMERGAAVDVLLEGFASPLANPVYNQALTERRVKSVENYFRNYHPVLNEAIDKKELNIKLIGFGESRAEGGSENRRDAKKSKYNEAASKERRVEIKGFTIRNVN
ncbi:MAG: hypothetical protein AAGG75_10070 [Bacteroidota bacterium]